MHITILIILFIMISGFCYSVWHSTLTEEKKELDKLFN